MSKIIIYGDESGTMPLKQSDGCFISATLASRIDLSSPIVPSDCPEWAIEELKRSGGQPSIFYVEPNAEYERLISPKLDKMNIMARARKLVTGNHDYLTRRGIIPRNILWINCMHQALADVIAWSLVKGDVSMIQIVLDQKTLQPETEKLFFDQISLLPKHVSMAIPDPDGNIGTTALKKRIMFTASTISVEWNADNPQPLGLRIAHHLASRAYRELSDSGSITFLEQAGYPNRVTNLTPILTKPINREVIQKWKEDTGMIEPHV